MKVFHLPFKKIPKTLTPRAVALQLVLNVIISGQSLAHQETLMTDLSAQDRGFVHELVLGVLRHNAALNSWVNQRIEKPLRKKDQWLVHLLELGVYQLVFLKMTPHGVVHSMVELVKVIGYSQFSGFINGVLRSVVRSVESQEISSQLKDKPGLPQWLESKIRMDWPDHWRSILKEIKNQPNLYLRVNQKKMDLQRFEQLLGNQSTEYSLLNQAGNTKDPAPYAIEILSKGTIQELPGFNEGYFAVQDLSAQIAVELLLQTLVQEPGQKWLDACAAPGGKTTYLLEHLLDSISLDIIDSQSSRLQRLQENLERLKLKRPGVQVICKDLLEHQDTYDAILLDAPCSGTGVLKRHPDIAWCRRASDISVLASLQSAMLHHCFELLKPGGFMLYTTCSILREENSLNIEAFMEQQGHRLQHINVSEAIGLKETYGIQRLPGLVQSDGFYYCMIQKKLL